MDKLKMASENLVEQNIDKIAELFPNCLTEMVENGEGKRKIDFDLLKQELSSVLVEGKDERYRLDWSGKRQAILTANSPIAKTLRPVKNDEDKPSGADSLGQPYASSGSVGKNGENGGFDSENLYIEGDNLDVLKLLHETYLSKIKMIYIDPPYNTGNDFVYRDDFAEDAEEYLVNSNQQDEQGNRLTTNKDTSGRYHSDWLSMMYMRLKIARDLLTDDGVIFISIDDNEQANLKRICDEIFGESNFVGNIAWESKTKSQNTLTAFNKLQPKVEHILLYTKADKRRFNLVKLGSKEYNEYDERGAYRWFKMEPMNALGIRGRETMIYPILGVLPPEGKQWQIGIELLNNLLNLGDVKIQNNSPYIKLREGLERSEITEPFWGFISKDIGTAESAKKELSAIIGSHGFETVKPVNLIKKLIFHATESKEIVLDFFSGSATTAHAVMQLNAEDGGNRKFIMVQVPEVTDENSEAAKAGYKNICEIGKERIRRSGAKIAEENRLLRPDLDVGFRVLKLDDSNMQDVYYNPNELKQADLFGLQSSIKEDRTAEDVLFQIMLDKGVLLSSKIVKRTTQNGKQSYYVVGKSDHDIIDLICCLDNNIDTEAVKEIAKLKPECCVFLDSSMANDSTRTNIEQIFITHSPSTKVEVI